jgi:hypothetical protein
MMELYMLTMSGQGDTHVVFVDKDIWDWIGRVHDKRIAKGPVILPTSVEEKFKKKAELEGQEYEPPYLSTGSPTNDAALAAPGHFYGTESNPSEAAFCNVKEAMAFVREHNVEIVDTWEGYIY